MHSILTSLSVLFKSSYLSIQSVPAKFKVSKPVLGDLAIFLSLPWLRHMARVPFAPLAADILAVLQQPVVKPDVQPEALFNLLLLYKPMVLNLRLAANLRLHDNSDSGPTRIGSYIFVRFFVSCWF